MDSSSAVTGNLWIVHWTMTAKWCLKLCALYLLFWRDVYVKKKQNKQKNICTTVKTIILSSIHNYSIKQFYIRSTSDVDKLYHCIEVVIVLICFIFMCMLMSESLLQFNFHWHTWADQCGWLVKTLCQHWRCQVLSVRVTDPIRKLIDHFRF